MDTGDTAPLVIWPANPASRARDARYYFQIQPLEAEPLLAWRLLLFLLPPFLFMLFLRGRLCLRLLALSRRRQLGRYRGRSALLLALRRQRRLRLGYRNICHHSGCWLLL